MNSCCNTIFCYTYLLFCLDTFSFGHRNTPIRNSFSFSLSLMGVAYHIAEPLRDFFYCFFICRRNMATAAAQITTA